MRHNVWALSLLCVWPRWLLLPSRGRPINRFGRLICTDRTFYELLESAELGSDSGRWLHVFFHSTINCFFPALLSVSLMTGGQGCSSLWCCVQRQQRKERSDPCADGDTCYCKCNKTFTSWKSTNITSFAEAISTTCSTSINVHHISA